MKRNSSKILIFLLLISTLTIFQCLGPNKGQWSLYDDNYSESVQIIDKWHTIDASWNFEEKGKLTITTTSQISKAYWTEEENRLVIIINDEKTVYDVDVISEMKIKLYTNDKEIVLEK
jgi:hypothetical protein